jgi:Secretion system C-terminal sorting domain
MILTIEYKDEKYKTINISNSQGVLMEKVNAVSPKQQLDFSKFKNGLYILEFKKNSGQICRIKVLKS